MKCPKCNSKLIPITMIVGPDIVNAHVCDCDNVDFRQGIQEHREDGTPMSIEFLFEVEVDNPLPLVFCHPN